MITATSTRGWRWFSLIFYNLSLNVSWVVWDIENKDYPVHLKVKLGLSVAILAYNNQVCDMIWELTTHRGKWGLFQSSIKGAHHVLEGVVLYHFRLLICCSSSLPRIINLPGSMLQSQLVVVVGSTVSHSVFMRTFEKWSATLLAADSLSLVGSLLQTQSAAL